MITFLSKRFLADIIPYSIYDRIYLKVTFSSELWESQETIRILY